MSRIANTVQSIGHLQPRCAQYHHQSLCPRRLFTTAHLRPPVISTRVITPRAGCLLLISSTHPTGLDLLFLRPTTWQPRWSTWTSTRSLVWHLPLYLKAT